MPQRKKYFEKGKRDGGKNSGIRVAMCTGCAGIHTGQGDTLKVVVSDATKFFVSGDEEIFGAVMLMA